MHFLEAAGRHWKFNRLKIGEKYQFPSISISAAAEENDEDADTILSFKTPEMGQFCEASKKASI